MSHRLISWSLLLCASTVHAAALAAQTALELDSLSIEATRGYSELGKTAQKITVITREQIEEQLKFTSDQGQILSNLIPSYSPIRQKMSSAGETFRGRTALIMIDGVPQSTPLRNSSRDGYVIDMALVERIEVIYGASAEHGMGATGGIINYITRRPEEGTLKQTFGVSVNTPNPIRHNSLSYQSNYQVQGSQGNLDYVAGLAWQKRGTFRDANHHLIGIDETQGDIMNSDSTDLMLKLGYWLDEAQRAEIMVNNYQLEGDRKYRAVAGDRNTHTPATSEKGRALGRAPENTALSTQFTYMHDDWYGNQLKLNLFSPRFRALFGGNPTDTFQDPAYAPIGTLFDQSQNESDKYGAKFSISRNDLFDDRLGLTAGLDVLQDTTRQVLVETSREWVPKTQFRNWAPFVQAQYQLFEPLTLSAGLRYEHAELKVDNYRVLASQGGYEVQGGKPTFHETLHNLGAVWQINESYQLFANYAQGFGMPDVGRVLRGISQPNQSVANFLSLEPIVTDNKEIGLRFAQGDWDAEISYYQSNSDLGSRLVNVGGLFQVRRERTEIHGVESTVGWQASDIHRLEAFHSYIRGKSDTDGDDKVDTRLDGANIAPDRSGITWKAQWNDAWSSQVIFNHYHSRSFDDPALRFKGMSLVDASISRTLPVGELSVGVDNLFNTDYFTYHAQAAGVRDDQYFKGRGRTVTLGYQVSF